MKTKSLIPILLVLVTFTPEWVSAQCPNVPEVCNNGIDDDCDGFIDCYDSDCQGNSDCSNFYFGQSSPECQEIPTVDPNFGLVEVWASQDLIDTRCTPIIGDIDGDGTPEVVAHHRNPQSLYVMNGLDGSTEVAINAQADQYSQSAAIADVDGDGLGEIYIAQNDGRLYCFENDGNPKVGFNPPFIGSNTDDIEHAYSASFADFNGDGQTEVYVANQIFDALTGQLLSQAADPYNDPKGSANLNGHAFSAAWDILPDSYCANCSGVELICGNTVYAVDLGNQLTPASTAPNPPDTRDGKVSLADWNNDGNMDIIVSSLCCGNGGAIYIWDPLTNVIVAGPVDAQGTQNTQVGNAAVADFDGDNQLELGYASNNEFFILDNDLTVLWSMSVSDVSNQTSCTAFDFEGDGASEIIYRDEVSLFILNGANGNIKAQTTCGSATRTDNPIIADVNGDGDAEIICACADVPTGGQGRIKVFESNTNVWINTRRVWHQRNYTPVYINDDLTVPPIFQDKTTLPNQDIYLAQSPIVDNTGEPIFAGLKDLVSRIDSVNFADCASDSGTAYITMCNEDLNTLEYNYPLSVYVDDPLSGGALLHNVQITAANTNIVSSRCIQIPLNVPNGAYDLHIYVNDDGTNPAGAPTIGIEECDSTNNLNTRLVNPCNLPLPADTLFLCEGEFDTVEVNAPYSGIFSGSEPFTQIHDSLFILSPNVNTTYFYTRGGSGNLIINGGIEEPNIGFAFSGVTRDSSQVPGWQTTVTDGSIELWRNGNFNGLNSYAGSQFLEIISSDTCAVYQDIATAPGETLTWEFAHAGKNADETMFFQAGPPNGPWATVQTATDARRIWGLYNGSYTVPAGQTITRFRFYAPVASQSRSGNLLDEVSISREAEIDTFIVVVNPNPIVDLGRDTSICIGEDITLDAENAGSSFAWNTGVTNQTLLVNAVGNYSVEVTNTDGCSTVDSITILALNCNEIIIPDTVTICEDDSTTIVANGLTNPTWLSNAFFNEENDSTITVSPAVPGARYYVYDTLRQGNVIINGDFENGAVGFTSEYTEDCFRVPWMINGGYCVDDNPNDHNGVFQPCGDHTTGTGNMMVIDATTTPGEEIWCQVVPTAVNTDYEFSAWIATTFDPNPAILQFQINGILIGNTLNASPTTCDWQNYAATWNSGIETSAEICLVNQNTVVQGNDFALDDIEFAPITILVDSVLVITNPNPVVDLGPDSTICIGEDISLDAGNTGSNFAWNTLATTQVINTDTAGTFIVSVTDANGCTDSDTINIATRICDSSTVTVLEICEGQQDTLIMRSPYTGTMTGTEPFTQLNDSAYLISPVNTTIFEYNRGAIIDTFIVNILSVPDVNLGSDVFICEGDSVTLDPGNIGTTYLWSTTQTTQEITVSQTNQYTVEVSQNGCIGIDSVNVTVNLNPSVDLGSDTTICDGDSVLLNAANPGSTYLWNDGSSNQSLQVSIAGQYNVTVTNANGCTSSDSIEVQINPLPTIANVSAQSDTICESDAYPVLLGNLIDNSLGSLETGVWTSLDGILFNQIGLDATINPGSLIAGVSYQFVYTIDNQLCFPVSTDTVLLTIDQAPSTPTLVTPNPLEVCTESTEVEANPIPILDAEGTWSIINNAGGTASFDPVNINNLEATINGLSAGTSTVRFTVSNGVCPSASVDLDINKIGDITAPELSLDGGVFSNTTVTDSAVNLCANTLYTLAGNNPNTAGGETAVWSTVSGSSAINNPGGNNPLQTLTLDASGVQPTRLQWTMNSPITACGSDSGFVDITVFDPPTAEFTLNEDTICDGGSLGYLPVVFNGSFFFDALNNPDPDFIITGSGLENVTIEDFGNSFVLTYTARNSGCPDAINDTTIFILPTENPQITLSTDTLICEGNDIVANSTIGPWVDIANSNVSVNWTYDDNTGNGNIPSSSSSAQATIDESAVQIGITNVNFEVAYDYQCMSNTAETRTSIQINVLAQPNPQIQPGDTLICETDLPFTYEIENIQSGSSIIWNDDNSLTETTLAINNTSGSGQYFAIENNGICPEASTDTVNLIIATIPQVTIAIQNGRLIDNEAVMLSNESLGIESGGSNLGFWNILNGPAGNAAFFNPDSALSSNFTPNGFDGNYLIQFTGYNNSDIPTCAAFEYLNILVRSPVMVPDGFTPNGDGINDAWLIGGIEGYEGAKITIYGRWGNILYEKANWQDAYRQDPWLGTTGSSVLPEGLYYYTIDLNISAEESEFLGQESVISGTVMLMR